MDFQERMERVRKWTDKLEAGITNLFQSDQYAAYLRAISKLHQYSYGNILLIKLQCPHFSMVAGYGDWKRKYGRYVKAGETGITILAPCPYWTWEEMKETAPDGQTVREKKWVRKIGFTTATVFDISQTEGREVPSLGVKTLTGTVEGYEKLLSALKALSPVPVTEGSLPPGVHGAYYHLEQKITLSPGMSQAQTVKTLIHEIVHAKLHPLPVEGGIILGAHEKGRPTREVEAESVAYTVCQYLGLDTGDYSFGYIAGWSGGKEQRELRASLDCIRNTAAELIGGIENRCLDLPPPEPIPPHRRECSSRGKKQARTSKVPSI